MTSESGTGSERHVALCSRFPAAGDVVRKWGLPLLVATFRRIEVEMVAVLLDYGISADHLQIGFLEERLAVVVPAAQLPALCRVAVELEHRVGASVKFLNDFPAHLGQAIAPCDPILGEDGGADSLGWAQSATVYLADRIARIAQPRQILIDEAALLGAMNDLAHLKLTSGEEVDLQGVHGPRRVRSVVQNGRPHFVRNLPRLRPQLKCFEDRLAAVMAEWQSLQDLQTDLPEPDAVQDRAGPFRRIHSGIKAMGNDGGPMHVMLSDFSEASELPRQTDLEQRLREFLTSQQDLLALLKDLIDLPYDARQDAPVTPIIELMAQGYEKLSSLHRLADSLIREGDGISVLDPPNRRQLNFLQDAPPPLSYP